MNKYTLTLFTSLTGEQINRLDDEGYTLQSVTPMTAANELSFGTNRVCLLFYAGDNAESQLFYADVAATDQQKLSDCIGMDILDFFVTIWESVRYKNH